MRLVLFALTGLGNDVLATLCAAGYRPDLLVTRREKAPHPYYPLPFIGEAADAFGVRWIADDDVESAIPPDLCEAGIVSTFHHILRAPLRARFKRLVNLHPGLLPHNRGASPIYWSIRNGDKETGVTAHHVTGDIDAGDVTRVEKVVIDPEETQSSLRLKLGRQAAKIAVDLAGDWWRGFEPPRHRVDIAQSVVRPRVTPTMRPIDAAWPASEVMRHVRALRDSPLATFHDRAIWSVVRIATSNQEAAPGTILSAKGSEMVVRVGDGDVVLTLAERARPVASPQSGESPLEGHVA